MLDRGAAPAFSLRPSNGLALILGAGHLAAWICCIVVWPYLWSGIFFALLLTFSAWRSIWRGALKHAPDAVIELKPVDGRSAFRTRSGHWFERRVASSSRVTPWLVVLALEKSAGTSHVCIVVPCDGLSADEFRRLRVWLRWWPREIEAADGSVQ